MKSFKYRGFSITARNRQGKYWLVTLDGTDPFTDYEAWYNIEREVPCRWWRGYVTRTFEEALNNVLECADHKLMRQAKSDEHERLMEARLSLAEELLLP